MSGVADMRYLIERSSLGAPGARAARSLVPPPQGRRIAQTAASRGRPGSGGDPSQGSAVAGHLSAVYDPPGVDHGEGNSTMGKAYRSAITGRYVGKGTAARHPRTTVAESGGNKGSGTHHRSAITGRYVTPQTAARHPRTTVTENG